jgi:hypothetical protein
MRCQAAWLNWHYCAILPLRAFFLGQQVFSQDIALYDKAAADLLWNWRLNRLRRTVRQKEQGRKSQRGVVHGKHFSSPFAYGL